jgi:hypothetical protein
VVDWLHALNISRARRWSRCGFGHFERSGDLLPHLERPGYAHLRK